MGTSITDIQVGAIDRATNIAQLAEATGVKQDRLEKAVKGLSGNPRNLDIGEFETAKNYLTKAYRALGVDGGKSVKLSDGLDPNSRFVAHARARKSAYQAIVDEVGAGPQAVEVFTNLLNTVNSTPGLGDITPFYTFMNGLHAYKSTDTAQGLLEHSIATWKSLSTIDGDNVSLDGVEEKILSLMMFTNGDLPEVKRVTETLIANTALLANEKNGKKDMFDFLVFRYTTLRFNMGAQRTETTALAALQATANLIRENPQLPARYVTLGQDVLLTAMPGTPADVNVALKDVAAGVRAQTPDIEDAFLYAVSIRGSLERLLKDSAQAKEEFGRMLGIARRGPLTMSDIDSMLDVAVAKSITDVSLLMRTYEKAVGASNLNADSLREIFSAYLKRGGGVLDAQNLVSRLDSLAADYPKLKRHIWRIVGGVSSDGTTDVGALVKGTRHILQSASNTENEGEALSAFLGGYEDLAGMPNLGPDQALRVMHEAEQLARHTPELDATDTVTFVSELVQATGGDIEAGLGLLRDAVQVWHGVPVQAYPDGESLDFDDFTRGFLKLLEAAQDISDKPGNLNFDSSPEPKSTTMQLMQGAGPRSGIMYAASMLGPRHGEDGRLRFYEVVNFAKDLLEASNGHSSETLQLLDRVTQEVLTGPGDHTIEKRFGALVADEVKRLNDEAEED